MPRSEQSWASSPAIRKSMQSNRPRDTAPERALRSAVHALGLRYRVGVRPVPGLRRTGDLVFTRAKVVVFLDGCFWHGCPTHHTAAKTNADYWADKVVHNRRRDLETDRLLADAGWAVLRVWEHDAPAEAALRVAALVLEQTAQKARPSGLHHPGAPRQPRPGSGAARPSAGSGPVHDSGGRPTPNPRPD